MMAGSATMVLTIVVCCQLLAAVEAGQGCPFDDGSCQEYCSQQGCNMGYCGHFAWIQCICRKCGDEWSWYDKVHYNPDKTVNQTELDSLKLNATSPLILTNSSTGQQLAASSNSTATSTSTSTATSSARAANHSQEQQQQQQQRATLTTLLIPDLSDGSKLDLNDIPDENSDKFLDYLAKNHERLVQATSKDPKQQQQSRQLGSIEDQLTGEELVESATTSQSAQSGGDDETVEIQISTNNNNNSAASSQQQQQTTDSPTTSSATEEAASSTSGQQQQVQKSPFMRLLHMASDEQLFVDASEQ